jgi:hypothetical protein
VNRVNYLTDKSTYIGNFTLKMSIPPKRGCGMRA